MHLRQPGFTYSVCGPFKKNKKWIKIFKEMGHSGYFHQKELDKAFFKNGMAYGHSKDLTRRTASNKILRDKAFDIIKNPKYDENQHGLASMVYIFLDKKSSCCGTKNENISNEELAEELEKPIIKQFGKRKVNSYL